MAANLELRKPGPPGEGPGGTGAPDADRDIGLGRPRIRCPLCAWVPRAQDRWWCTCGHVWNTFDTRGRCPACDHRWKTTQCLACHEHSAHEAWYVSAPPSRASRP